MRQRHAAPTFDLQRGTPIRLGAQISLTSLIPTLAAAEHLNFRHASNALGVRLSSVSARVKALEENLGVLLSKRHARGVRLTEAGIPVALGALALALVAGLSGVAARHASGATARL